MGTLLVIDDEPSIAECLRMGLADADVNLVAASTAADGMHIFAQTRPDAVCLDINLPDSSGLEAIRQLHELDPKVPIIIMTGSGTMANAIQATALGAYDYVLKPFDLATMLALVNRAFATSRLMRIPAVLPTSAEPAENVDILVGQCAAMQEVYKAIGRVAQQNLTVLILGESGTGKELVARAIYHYSRRADGPFVAINCAAIPETLLESELFGHEKGAFTGADQRRIGKFEQCQGGTLFLDEIGDMTPTTQAKILRVLQERQFERIGGNQTIQTDVRVIAATNRDLEGAVAAKQFREDLFYRLNVFSLRLPPLRKRLEDLPILVDHFLRRFGRELAKPMIGVAPESMRLLKRYRWPGNLRELQSVLKQAILQASGPMIVPDFLPASLRTEKTADVTVSDKLSAWDQFLDDQLAGEPNDLYAKWLKQTDRHVFVRVLRHTGGNLTQAAKILGLHPMTLRTKLRQLGLHVERAMTDKAAPTASSSSESIAPPP